MILVDTSVWIELLRGTGSAYHKTLSQMIANEVDIAISDIILMEVLQGVQGDEHFFSLKDYLTSFPVYSLKNTDSYIRSAELYRGTRKNGATVKPVDCLIAMSCIENDLPLFHNNKDFRYIAEIEGSLKLYENSEGLHLV